MHPCFRRHLLKRPCAILSKTCKLQMHCEVQNLSGTNSIVQVGVLQVLVLHGGRMRTCACFTPRACNDLTTCFQVLPTAIVPPLHLRTTTGSSAVSSIRLSNRTHTCTRKLRQACCTVHHQGHHDGHPSQVMTMQLPCKALLAAFSPVFHVLPLHAGSVQVLRSMLFDLSTD